MPPLFCCSGHTYVASSQTMRDALQSGEALNSRGESSGGQVGWGEEGTLYKEHKESEAFPAEGGKVWTALTL